MQIALKKLNGAAFTAPLTDKTVVTNAIGLDSATVCTIFFGQKHHHLFLCFILS
ncbi:hypothetical protein ABEO83_18250 [Bacillus glycinifermentans]|uniref:hypothetical protein n=1 Tax=Bacillus glycinifermentans TaxID=1664069 RepID=UPI003D231CE5